MKPVVTQDFTFRLEGYFMSNFTPILLAHSRQNDKEPLNNRTGRNQMKSCCVEKARERILKSGSTGGECVRRWERKRFAAKGAARSV